MPKTVNSDSIGSYISASGLLQVIKSDVKKASANYLCRIVPGRDREWLTLMEKLLTALEGTDCEAHFCRKYLLKDGRMVYAWHLGFKGKLGIAEQLFAGKLVPESSQGLKQRKKGQGLIRPAKAILSKLTPRRPDDNGSDPVIPSGVKIGLIIVEKKQAANGTMSTVEEMPLPHVYKDLNVPNKKQRGATGGLK